MNDVTTGSSGTDLETIVAKIEQKFGRWKWAIGLAAVLVLGPLFWALSYAFLGAGALALSIGFAFVATMAVVHGAPVALMKIKRMKIEAVRAEATKYPIPTLLDQWAKDKAENNKMDEAVTREETAVLNFAANVEKMNGEGKLTPAEYAEYQGEIALMKQDVEEDKLAYAELVAQAAEFKRQIEKADSIWKLETERQAVNAVMMSANTRTALDRIARETAFDSILRSQAVGRAQLSQRMRNRPARKSAPALTNNPSPAITQLGQVQDVEYVQKGKSS